MRAQFTAVVQKGDVICMEEKHLNMVPLWHKYSLSIEEAAKYYGIGEKRLRRLAYEHEGDNFLLEVGNRIRFKRKLFEDYLDVAAMV